MYKSLFFVSAALFAATTMASDPGAPSTLSMQDRAAVAHAIDQDRIVEASAPTPPAAGAKEAGAEAGAAETAAAASRSGGDPAPPPAIGPSNRQPRLAVSFCAFDTQ